ncbi:ATP-grasp domain-containing protein [Micromonospora echinofusca]|uniref:ATP-grasp domain-containing protein n=1 Tax=Micromonospora echinofusca TaxID=47858 RepID=A0ABS3VVJ9_MICEH|nr:ATP-grasp domain-containing protein [Micromonospora echinofusca]MBO4208572.1 ATP-grasp domain-containing protein [Micromonospora echinofusca]
MLFLVPHDPLNPRRPDPHFAAEAAAARDAGWQVGLVDHDALGRPGGAVGAAARVPAGGPARYRGWMLSADRYADFADALAHRDVTLVTGAAEYRRAHELPGWYGTLAGATPESYWTVGAERDDVLRTADRLGSGPAVLRDYTKSMKHHWHEAAYLPDVADHAGVWRVARRFLELRGDDFTGGLVVRRFERFAGREVRTWWRHGRCVLVGPHPDTDDGTPLPEPDGAALTGLADLVGGTGLDFVTVDLVRRDDGRWRVVELGDGQVSDRPASISPARFLAAVTGAGC